MATSTTEKITTGSMAPPPKDPDKMVAARTMGANVTALYPHVSDVAEAVRGADIVVGAVLVTGARAPHVVSADMVRTMEPGSVIVDISVDQGGCVETTRPTTYEAPTYQWERCSGTTADTCAKYANSPGPAT